MATPSKFDRTISNRNQRAREKTPTEGPTRYKISTTNKPIRRLSELAGGDDSSKRKSTTTINTKLQTASAGIQNTLQRVCHQLIRRKTPTSPLGESRGTSAASKTPEAHNVPRSFRPSKSSSKMPVTFISGTSATEAAGIAPDSLTSNRRASTGDDDTAIGVTVSRPANNKKKFAAVLPASPTTTPTKKSPLTKKMGTAEDYHNVILTNRSAVVPIIPERLYLARLQDVPVPRVSDVAVFFSTDEEYMYENFFDDFGPLNIGNVYRYCKKIEKKMRLSGGRGRKVVHVGYAGDNRLFANTAWLIGAYCIVVEKMSPDVVFERVSSLLNQTDLRSFPAFRDAATGPSSYDLSLLDCFRALSKAVQYGFFNYDAFNIMEYEHYEKVENGDFNWISSKFLAFCGPSATTRLDNGYPLHAPEVYFSYFRKHNVTTIVRLNAPQYPAKRFTDAGFEHHDLIYPDGTSPPLAILNRFLRICENSSGAIAVHCKAGLGRTGTLIGAYLMKHYRLTTAEAIAWLRIARPGSVIGQQQHFLEDVKDMLWKQGDQSRRQLATSAIAATTTTTDAGASGDAGLTKAETTTSEAIQQNQKQNAETGFHTPPVSEKEEKNKVPVLSTPPSAGKATADEVISDTNIGTPGKEARVRRQNDAAGTVDAGNIAGLTGSVRNGTVQLKGRQAIRRGQQQSDGVAAQNSASIPHDGASDDEIAASGASATGGQQPVTAGHEQLQRRTSVDDSANKNKKPATGSSATPAREPMATRRSVGLKSSPVSDLAASTTTTSNKRKRLYAAGDEKSTGKASSADGQKAALLEEQIVTEEDIEGLISHAETVDEMAAATNVSKRQGATQGRTRKATPINIADEAAEAVQPTQTTSDAVNENPLAEEARNERLMDLFRANKLDKVATVAESSSSDGVSGAEALGTVGDIEIAAPNCHLVSDTQHLTQGDMLNMAKAKRSVYPFGFGRGAGHGSPPSKKIESAETNVATVNEAGTKKTGLRSANRDQQPEKQTQRRSTVPTVSSQPPTPNNNGGTPPHLGRTRRESRALATGGDNNKKVLSASKVTPQRGTRGPTPPMPATGSGDAAGTNSTSPRELRKSKLTTRPASTTPATKASMPVADSNNGDSAKVPNSSKPSRSERKASPAPSASYSLRSKPGRASYT